MPAWLWKLLGVGDSSPASRKKLGVIALLYFIQGAPAAILWEVLPVYFRINGVSLRAIGGLRLLELPYSLKVFWSPLVHRYGDRRWWVAGMHAGHCGGAIRPTVRECGSVGVIVLVLILALTTLSATQDVAIDSYSVALVNREEEGAANGVRASAYRVALVFVGGGLVFLAAVLAWNRLFILAGVVFALLALTALAVPKLNLPEASARALACKDLSWAGTWRVVPLILFVLTYKLGEFAIGPMVKPFWVDYGKIDLADPRRFDVSDRTVPNHVRHRAERRWRACRRRVYFALRHFSRRVVARLAAGGIQSRLFFGRVAGSRPFRTLRRLDVRVAQRRARHRGIFSFFDERLRQRARHGAICVFIFGIFPDRPFDRRHQRTWARRNTATAIISPLLFSYRCRLI